MHLTSFTDYGLRTLMYLGARPNMRASVKEISEYYGISRNHLVKVVHRLSQLGYVEATKGKGGGVRISKDALKLRLGDLIAEFEPNMYMAECFDAETNTCRITQGCQLKHYLLEATQSYTDVLNQYTVADTVAEKGFLFSGGVQ